MRINHENVRKRNLDLAEIQYVFMCVCVYLCMYDK